MMYTKHKMMYTEDKIVFMIRDLLCAKFPHVIFLRKLTFRGYFLVVNSRMV